MRIKNTNTTYLKRKYIFKIILQNICYYLGTYKIGIYEIEITQKNDWSNYYLDLYDELAIKIDQNRKCGPNQLRNEKKSKKWKWFKMVWKYYHDEMWHFKEVQTMTGIHTLRSKICSYCVAITVVIILFFLPPLKYFPCSKNHWYIKCSKPHQKKENLVVQRTAKLFFGPRANSWSKFCTNDKLKVVIV